jgi:D-alanyl-D-alanine carboxypeptidase (penicillin-binding protein 5/6)
VASLAALTLMLGSGAPAAGASASATFVPCPHVKIAPNRPPLTTSPMPVHDETPPAIGGDAMATNGLAVPAGAAALPKTISATSWVVADLDSGDVLGTCGPHVYGAPASVQKLLLVAAVLPKLNPVDVITVTEKDLDFEPGSSAVGLIEGGKYTVETLWLGLLLNSGNDAANVLARVGGGAEGVPGAIAAMNAEAARLGALDTHAMTPSGLDGPGQMTSAYDLALIARACFAREDFRRYAATRNAKIPPQPPKDKLGFQIQNDNRLLMEYPGALGGKTGFTDIARHTYVGAASRNGRTLVVTMLGGEHKPARMWQQAAALLDWGFAVSGEKPVGRLVEPGEVGAKPTAAPGVAGPIAAGRAGPSGQDLALVGAGAGALLVLAWTVLLLLFARRRRAHQGP